MKKIFTLIITAALALPALSQQMMIEKSGNKSDVVSLDDLRRITFSGSDVNVLKNDGTTINAQMGDINRIYFGDFTRIEEIAADSRSLITYLTGDEIAVNCAAGEIINVYNINGSQIISVTQQADGGSISISQLPKGIYLLQAAGRTAKFIKR